MYIFIHHVKISHRKTHHNGFQMHFLKIDFGTFVLLYPNDMLALIILTFFLDN